MIAAAGLAKTSTAVQHDEFVRTALSPSMFFGTAARLGGSRPFMSSDDPAAVVDGGDSADRRHLPAGDLVAGPSAAGPFRL